MKQSIRSLCKLALFTAIIVPSLCWQDSFSQSVAINNTASPANASALLDVGAAAGGDTKGLLIPRVALTAINSVSPITSPATSLLVYNTATAGTTPNIVIPGYYYWNGTKWVALGGGNGGLSWGLLGNAGTTAGTNFIGTTDGIDLIFKTNAVEKMRILSNGYVGIGTSTITPSTVLVVSSDGNAGAAGSPSLIVRGKDNKERIQLESYGANPGPVYNGVGARGPVEAPTQTIAGDILVGLGGRGYDNAGAMSGNAGLLLVKAEENFTSSAQGTYFSFNTTKVGLDYTSRSEKMRLSSAGFLGIGTTTPQVELHVLSTIPTSTGNLHPYRTGALIEGDNGTFGGRLAIHQAGRNAALTLFRTSGSFASRSALSSGDTMAVISFGGYDGNAVNSFYAISAIANETWSNSAHGSNLTFNTPSNGTGWGGSEKMRITSEGNVGIGTNNPLGKLHDYGDLYVGTGTTTYPSTPAGSYSNIILKGNAIDARLVMNDGTGSFQQYLNSYYDATSATHKYTTSTLATRLTASAGTFGFYVAPSGTAGNAITWTTGLFIANSGNVGIGTISPGYALDVCGDIASHGVLRAIAATVTGGLSACSDIRYKKDIAPLADALSNVMKLQGVNYLWKKDEFPNKMFNDKKQIGFIAQEIEKIYPELVFTDDDGYKSVDYSRLTPILVEALKEQQVVIDGLKAENSDTKKRLEKVEAFIGMSVIEEQGRK